MQVLAFLLVFAIVLPIQKLRRARNDHDDGSRIAVSYGGAKSGRHWGRPSPHYDSGGSLLTSIHAPIQLPTVRRAAASVW